MKLNKVMVIGNLGRDPSETHLPSGTVGSTFPIAANREWTDHNGERHSETTWFLVRVSNNQAAACNQYLYKGREVFVEGHLRVSEFGGPIIYYKNGESEPRTSFELIANTVEFGADTRRQSNAVPDGYGGFEPQGQQSATTQEDESDFQSEDEFPF